MQAGAVYILDTCANALLANYEEYEDLFLTIFAVPSVIAEMWLGLWLLFRGGQGDQRQRGRGWIGP
jgi:hypothetical protein